MLDRKKLAEKLDVCVDTIDKLRSEEGFPEFKVGDAPRFRLDAVLRWLEARGKAAT